MSLGLSDEMSLESFEVTFRGDSGTLRQQIVPNHGNSRMDMSALGIVSVLFLAHFSIIEVVTTFTVTLVATKIILYATHLTA